MTSARGARLDGDGWVECACGSRHWGRFGAAGLLLGEATPGTDGPYRVLLQHRALWSHEGGTWGLPGGARAGSESALAAAVREAGEEAGVPPAAVQPRGELVVDHGSWSYTTVVARARVPVRAAATDPESLELRWVPVVEVASYPLHSGFAAAWPVLRDALGKPPLRIVVDGANVVGSRPDGWWRDRAGAAGRLRDRLAALLGEPVPSSAFAEPPIELGRDMLSSWYIDPILVVEGAARSLPDSPDSPVGLGVPVVRAPASGDDALVDVVREELAGGAQVLAVTADRELARRAAAAGAQVRGPGWLLGLLGAPGPQPGRSV